MVAIVSGSTPGLNLGSREVLGAAGMVGNASAGRNGQGVYVNAATGALVLQTQDDALAARGQDIATVRTYNSLGSFNDDNGDNWSSNVVSLRLAGAVNAVGSTLQRVDHDGSSALYAFDAVRGLYTSNQGSGAYDTLAWVAADAQFEWCDGSTGATQRFEGSGALRLLSASDTSGNTLAYAYGSNGFLKSVTAANGDGSFYDCLDNNLSQVRTVAAGVTTTRVRYGYDTANRLAAVTVDLTPADNSVTDLKTYQTQYGYDGSSNRVALITQTDGNQLAFTYVLVGSTYRVETVTDALGQVSAFSYGTGFTSVRDPQGATTRFDYDATGRLTKITPPAAGGTTGFTQFTYNIRGDVLTTRDGAGRVVSFGYDANGNQVMQRDAIGSTVTRSFDARNQLVAETVYLEPDPDGAGVLLPGGALTTRYVYDASNRNQLRFSVSAEGTVTEHRYNGFGERVASITYAAASYPTSALAATDALSESTVAAWAASQDLGATQRVDFAYDGRGQLQSRTAYASVAAGGAGIVDGTESVERFLYDPAGQLLQTISGSGGTTTISYDGLGRVLSSTDAAGRLTLTQYDDAGGKVKVTAANGLVRTSAYDTADRLVAVSESNGAGVVLGETRYSYDASNRLRMTQDPTGVRSWILYDEAGRKAADIDGNGTMTEYAYNLAGQQTLAITRGNAVDVNLLAGADGQPVLSATVASVRPADSPADASEWRSYDRAGRLFRTARQGGASLARASVTETRYDAASRVIEVLRYANTIAADGTSGTPLPGSIAAPAASVQNRSERSFYDADGRLAGRLDGEGYLTTCRYTAAGQLAERIAYATACDPALRAAGTLDQLVPDDSPLDQHEVQWYDGKGQCIGRLDAEGFLTETVYDESGNATRSLRYATAVAAAIQPSTTLDSIRPKPSSADQVTVWGYDALNRLQEVGAVEVLPKPFDLDQLLDAVERCKVPQKVG
jgi:YD repeat-containing protein